MSPSAVKIWFLVHKWTSLICTVFMLLLCLTGLPLIFHHEINRALGYDKAPPELADTTERANLDEILAASRARAPGDAVQFLIRDAEEPIWFVRMGRTVDAPDVSAFHAYDARTGEFLGEPPANKGVMNALLRLHVDLFAGLPGMLFLGFMGLLLIASLISGAVLYGPFMRKLAFGTVRHKSRRLQWLDLHNLLGIATLIWFFVVGATGVVNTLAIPVFDRWKATQLAEMLAPYRNKPPLIEMGSVQRALDAARAAEPGTELSFMAFPGNAFAGPHHFVAFMRGTTPWTSKLLTPVLIDAESSQVAASRELPVYVSALLVSQPLHFGDYGGTPLKVLWALLDVLCIGVLGSGVYLWLRKRNLSVEAWLGAMESRQAVQS